MAPEMMTGTEATAFRNDYSTQVRALSRTSRAQLEVTDRDELAKRGMTRLIGQLSRDELISHILELRGYGIDRLNESTHVVAHVGQVIWDGCQWCNPAPDPDHVPSDDPPGADSSPMSELQRAGLLAAHTGPSEYRTVADELEQTDHMIASCRKLLEALEGKYVKLLARLADLESKPGIPRQDVSTALAEHTQPAIEAIERAAEPIPFTDGTPRCTTCHRAAHYPGDPISRHGHAYTGPLSDPFAGIPNADDRDNEPI